MQRGIKQTLNSKNNKKNTRTVRGEKRKNGFEEEWFTPPRTLFSYCNTKNHELIHHKQISIFIFKSLTIPPPPRILRPPVIPLLLPRRSSLRGRRVSGRIWKLRLKRNSKLVDLVMLNIMLFIFIVVRI